MKRVTTNNASVIRMTALIMMLCTSKEIRVGTTYEQ